MIKALTITLWLCLLFILPSGPLSAQSNDFAVKAFHLDMRIQVMTMPALKSFVQKLHDGGINTLIMEYEANYPYEGHAAVPGKYAYSREEILSLVKFCNGLGIDLVPLQQSFGHVEYILRHYRYAGMREDEKDLSQVCPLELARDTALFASMYRELAATHTSKYIHIGCDETHLLGHCPKCQKKVAEQGISRLYLDYVKTLCQIVIKMGKRPILWADVALKYPEALKILPKETILVDWNYGWDLSLFGEHKKLVESGLEIWGAPALRSHPDNYFLTQWEKHCRNIRDFIPLCRQMGYKGIVMTSWSTSGEYSPVYESTEGLVDLYAVRHVYPITGFNMLLAAYIKGIGSPGALDIDRFVTEYGVTRYGFTEAQSKECWQALKAAPYEVKDGIVQGGNGGKTGAGLTLAMLIDSAQKSAAVFDRLRPAKNIDEFEHYRLMAAMRLQYLQFLEIEKQVNDDRFTPAEIPALRQKLGVLKTVSETLSQRYTELNKETFHYAELETENRLRNTRLEGLYDRLARNR